MDDCLRAGEQGSACWFQSRDSGFAHTNLDENNQTANPLSSNEALRASLCSLDVRSRGSTCLQLGLAFLWLLCTILGSLWNTSEVPGHSEGGKSKHNHKGRGDAKTVFSAQPFMVPLLTLGFKCFRLCVY